MLYLNTLDTQIENMAEKEKCWLPAVNPFPQCFQNLFYPRLLNSDLSVEPKP